MNKPIIICCLLFIICFTIKAHSQKSAYKIENKFPIEGDGGWDYIASDESSGRLFTSHSQVTQVIEMNTGKLLETITDTKGVHGIAIDKEDNKAFISCGKDSSVSIINLTTLKLIEKINVTGANPDAILYDSFSHNVFVFNGRSSNATVLDAKTNHVVATIPLEGKPEFAVSDGNGKVYVNIEDKSLITVINSKSLKTETSWSVSPGEEPSGLALDNINHRLFSVCDNKKMIVMNINTGKIISTLDIGSHVDGCAYDPELKRAYSSNGDGTITVVQQESGDKYFVLETIQTQKGARTICINQSTHHLYLPTAEYGETPAPTNEVQHPRPSIKPGTFMILDVAPVK